jgi:hypothetical protein
VWHYGVLMGEPKRKNYFESLGVNRKNGSQRNWTGWCELEDSCCSKQGQMAGPFGGGEVCRLVVGLLVGLTAAWS